MIKKPCSHQSGRYKQVERLFSSTKDDLVVLLKSLLKFSELINIVLLITMQQVSVTSLLHFRSQRGDI